MPSWYLDEPQLLPGEEFYFSAFDTLSSCRNSGFGPSAIPWTALVQYAEWYNLPRDLEVYFVKVLQRLDAFYLKWLEENRPKDG